MLFHDITILDERFDPKKHMYVGTRDHSIAYIGDKPPTEDYGEHYAGHGKLLMPGFYNNHAHTPMTLMRGYGENLSLSDWLHTRIFPFEQKLTGEDVYWGMLLGIAESLRFGIVSSTDMYNFCEDMARALLETGMKGNIGRHVIAFGEEGLMDLACYREAEAFRAAFDGQGGGRVKADFALHAEYTSTPKVARELAEAALSAKGRMQVHVSETRVETDECKARHGKTPVRYLFGLGLFDVPATAAHCVWLEDADFELLKEKGVTVATCPASNLKLASGICDVPRLLKAGVNVTLGTDSVASNNNLNFMEEMKLFALLHKRDDPTAVSARQTLFAATRGAAIAQGRGDCGLMQTGCRADLIVLDIDRPNMKPVHDLLTNVVYAASGSDVLLTMVDGRVLYKNGDYLTLDIDKVHYGAEHAARGVLSRI